MGYEGLWVYTGFAKNRLKKSGKILEKSENIFGIINDYSILSKPKNIQLRRYLSYFLFR
jgi:hypothetical protein